VLALLLRPRFWPGHLAMILSVGIAVGLGLIELAIIATILVILLEVALLRGGQLISHGWYHPERNYELELETEAAANTLVAVQKLLTEEHISYTLVEYESAKKTDAVRLGLNVGLPESADTEKLTLQLLAAGARSVSWRLAKD
jgi:uncharacterized membrane protein YhiD involved in acid resistance